MVSITGTGLLNLTSYSGILIYSTLPSQDKSELFLSFSDMTHFLSCSLSSPYYKTILPASSTTSLDSEGSLMIFPKWMNLDSLDSTYSLAIAFLLSCIELAQRRLNF